MRSKYHLLSLTKEDSVEGTPLNIKEKTLTDIDIALRWQLQAGFDPQTYVKATRTGRDTFTCIKTGKTYKACKGAYTEDAFNRFLNSWEQA